MYIYYGEIVNKTAKTTTNKRNETIKINTNNKNNTSACSEYITKPITNAKVTRRKSNKKNKTSVR